MERWLEFRFVKNEFALGDLQRENKFRGSRVGVERATEELLGDYRLWVKVY